MVDAHRKQNNRSREKTVAGHAIAAAEKVEEEEEEKSTMGSKEHMKIVNRFINNGSCFLRPNYGVQIRSATPRVRYDSDYVSLPQTLKALHV